MALPAHGWIRLIMGAASLWENKVEQFSLYHTKKKEKKTSTPTDIPETERPSFRLILCKVYDVRMHQPTASLVTQPNVRPLHLHTNAGSLSTISNVFRPKPEIQRRLRIFHLATLKLWLYLAAKWKNQIVPQCC